MGLGTESSWRDARREYRKLLFQTGTAASKAGRFKALEPAIAQRILAGQQVPENERDAAELASKQISALLEWAENHSGEIYSFKIRTLQEFGLKVNELSWRGVDVAILMQEGLQQ